MDINSIPSYLIATLQSSRVKVRESNRIITIMPIDKLTSADEHNCPFLGIATDSGLTVDKFLEWKREERELEYEKELHS